MFLSGNIFNASMQSEVVFIDHLFDVLADKKNTVSISAFIEGLEDAGLDEKDPRLQECIHKIAVAGRSSSVKDVVLTKSQFRECLIGHSELIRKAFTEDLVIPEFKDFCEIIENIYEECKENDNGEPASYIPQLARVPREYWAVSLCTIDGQRKSFGDTDIPFCLQSTSKPLTYALALHEHGSKVVHSHIGREPSGDAFNMIKLDHNNKPHNPMINAGAIVTASLVKNGHRLADRFDYISQQYKTFAGGEYLGFNNAVYLSERESADRNFAIGYYMQEKKCFPPGVDLQDTLDFYFQLCSIEVTCESAAVIAATLANGGICPITGQDVLHAEAVRNTLSLMHSCGMYDYSGQFAFKVGLPAKSGVSGAILLVVPNVMGMCLWGPPLDEIGNSCRGLQFCEELVRRFNFHHYDNLIHTKQKKDPRKRQLDSVADHVVQLLFGAYNGDLSALTRMYLGGADMEVADYDGRTALHLASAEGHLDCVRFLLETCKVPFDPEDRWNNQPFDDAYNFQQNDVYEYLKAYGEKQNKLREDEDRLILEKFNRMNAGNRSEQKEEAMSGELQNGYPESHENGFQNKQQSSQHKGMWTIIVDDNEDEED